MMPNFISQAFSPDPSMSDTAPISLDKAITT